MARNHGLPFTRGKGIKHLSSSIQGSDDDCSSRIGKIEDSVSRNCNSSDYRFLSTGSIPDVVFCGHSIAILQMMFVGLKEIGLCKVSWLLSGGARI